MICFRDKTFCGSDCTNTDCGRYFGAAEEEAARRWWGGDGAPVAYANFSATCPDYSAPTPAITASRAAIKDAEHG